MRRRAGQHGFSLIELLVAMAIMGVALAVISPSIFRNLDAVRFSTAHDALLREIRALRVRALLEKRVYAFPPEGEDPFFQLENTPPEGWTASVDGDPIYFLETGICLGGTITVTNGKGRFRRTVFAAPDCAVAPAPSSS